MRIWKPLSINLVAILLLVVPVAAQSDEVVSEPVITGTVSGQIVNGTAGTELPDAMEVMLHVWDREFDEKYMLHGESEPGGRFQFDDVTLEPVCIMESWRITRMSHISLDRTKRQQGRRCLM